MAFQPQVGKRTRKIENGNLKAQCAIRGSDINRDEVRVRRRHQMPWPEYRQHVTVSSKIESG